jgi:2-iminobutanoate/2-iminopropanoate deaminase
MPEPMSHYTDVVRADDYVFVSGVAALDAEGKVHGAGDVVEQARVTLRNLGRVLHAAQASPADVVKVTIYLTDVGHRAAINPLRREFFGDARPASTLVGVAALVLPELLIEIEAIAYAPR